MIQMYKSTLIKLVVVQVGHNVERLWNNSRREVSERVKMLNYPFIRLLNRFQYVTPYYYILTTTYWGFMFPRHIH